MRTMYLLISLRYILSICTLIRAGSITGVNVIDDFPPFICDSCEYANTTRQTIRKVFFFLAQTQQTQHGGRMIKRLRSDRGA
jgi:hypothetical protein